MNHNQPLKEILTSDGFEQLKKGHPWIFKNHLKKDFSLPQKPMLYPLGEHWFLLSPQSNIILRRLGPSTRLWPHENLERTPIANLSDFETHFSEPLFKLLKNTFEKKQRLINYDSCFRWLFSENDYFPGLIIDVFQDNLVAQILSAPIEHFWPVIKKLILKVKPNAIIHEQRSHPIRLKEGLPIIADTQTLSKDFKWNGLQWNFSILNNQKTGTYLDQKENHLKALSWAQKLNVKEAWDVFCFEGGFTLPLAKENINVLAVDSSNQALENLKKNALSNKIEKNISVLKQDAFFFLKEQFNAKKKTDLIILDPPPFAKKASEKFGALKGYKELNLRAMHSLNTPGLLVSCSCSHTISRNDFLKMLGAASHDARKQVQILDVGSASPDHAPHTCFPEGDYLQSWFLLVS